jgi:hypothetical protein
MPQVGIETMISAGEQPQSHALERPATGIGVSSCNVPQTTQKRYGALISSSEVFSLLGCYTA